MVLQLVNAAEPEDDSFILNQYEKGLRPIKVKEHADGSKSIDGGSPSVSSDEDEEFYKE